MDEKKLKMLPDRDSEDIITQEELHDDLEVMLSVIDAEDVEDEGVIPTFDEDE